MFKRLLLYISVLGLCLAVVPWLGAMIARTFGSRTDTCIAFGYGHGEEWLVVAVVYPDAFVLAQCFNPNLSTPVKSIVSISSSLVRRKLVSGTRYIFLSSSNDSITGRSHQSWVLCPNTTPMFATCLVRSFQGINPVLP